MRQQLLAQLMGQELLAFWGYVEACVEIRILGLEILLRNTRLRFCHDKHGGNKVALCSRNVALCSRNVALTFKFSRKSDAKP